MPLYRMRGLGTKGVYTDVAPAELDANMFTDALNVRFAANAIVRIGGWQNIFLQMNNNSEGMYTFVRQALTDNYFIAGEKNIKVFTDQNGDATTVTTVTPAKITDMTNIRAAPTLTEYNIKPLAAADQNRWVSNNFKWTTTSINGLVVFNQPDHFPIGQTDYLDQTKKMIELPGWGWPNSADWDLSNPNAPVLKNPTSRDNLVEWRTNKIVSYKNYLICLGMWETVGNVASGSTLPPARYLPNRIRWSDISYEGQLPTNWIQDDPNHDGGFNDLLDATSSIEDGAPLKDSFIIYTGTECYIADYVGGVNIFNNRKLFSDVGLLTPGCVVEFEGKHFVVSREDVFIHDGSTRQSVIESRIRTRLFQEINSVNFRACRVYHNQARKEIWVTYPFTPRDTDEIVPSNTRWDSDRAAVYNYQYDTWTFFDIPDVWDVSYGTSIPSTNNKWSDYKGDDDPSTPPVAGDATWDGAGEEAWGIDRSGIGLDNLYVLSNDRVIYCTDIGNSKQKVVFGTGGQWTITTDVLNCFVEKVSFDMDDALPETIRNKTIRTIYPQSQGAGAYNIEIGGRFFEDQMKQTDSIVSYDSSQVAKVDFWSTRRYHYLKLSWTGNTNVKISGLDLEYLVEGTR